MDTRQLRYFKTVAELGSFSRASTELHISQPALSRHVKLLEETLDVKLMNRHSRGIQLTDAGRKLLKRAYVILNDLENLHELVQIDSDSQAGNVTIAVPPAVGVNLMPPLLKRFRDRYPKVTIDIYSGYSKYLQDSLNTRAVDLALLHNPEPRRGFVTVPLLWEPLYLLGTAKEDGRLSGEPVRLNDLASLPLIMPRHSNRFRARFDHEVATQGINLNVEVEVDGNSVLLSLVRAGLGYAVDTAGAAHCAVQHKEISVSPIAPKIELALCMEYWEDQIFSLPMNYLKELIPQVCGELIETGKWPTARLAEKKCDE